MMETDKKNQNLTDRDNKTLHISGSTSIDKSMLLQFRPGKYLASVQSPTLIKSQSSIRSKQSLLRKSMSIEKTDKLPIIHMQTPQSIHHSRKASPVNNESEKNTGLISSDQQSFNHSRGHSFNFNKDHETNLLKQRINDLERQLITSKNVPNPTLFLDFDTLNSLSTAYIEKEDPANLKKILQALIFKNYDTYKIITQRCNKLSALVNLLEYDSNQNLSDNDWPKVRIMINDLATTLSEASKNEINLGIKSRELEKKNIEYVKLMSRLEKVQERCLYFENQCSELNKVKTDLEEKLNSHIRLFEAETHKNAANEKKVSLLEKRIELILECDINVDKNKLRQALTELVKENETLKRNVYLKGKEITKQKEEISKLNHKITRQAKKIDSLLRNKKGPTPSLGGPIDEYDKTNSKQGDKSEDHFNLLNQETLPYSLDFRLNSLRLQHTELLRDIMEQGSSVFLSQFGQIDKDKKEALHFIASQLVSIKDFADKLNFFVREFFEMLLLKDNAELMIFLNKNFKNVFNSENLNLWLADGITGSLYTINEEKKEFRCLASKGIFSEIIHSGKPVNKKNIKNAFLCEFSLKNEKYLADSALIFPIKNSYGKTYGLFEISNPDYVNYGYDEEYYGLSLCRVISYLLNRNAQENILANEQKMRSILFEAFYSFCESDSEYDLEKRIREWSQRIFGVSNSSFLYVENNNLIDYTSIDSVKYHELSMGIAGKVAKSRRSLIVTDTESSPDFNKLIDLVSILPVFFVPIFKYAEDPSYNTSIDPSENKVVGLLQIILKSKTQRQGERITNADDIINIIGLDDITNTLMINFSKMVSVGLNAFKTKKNCLDIKVLLETAN